MDIRYTRDAIHPLTKVEEGDSAAAEATFGTQDWSPTIGGRNNCLSQTGSWNGAGGPSYIDSVVTRDRDNAAWNAAAQSGTGANAWAIAYSEFVLQNWRANECMKARKDMTNRCFNGQTDAGHREAIQRHSRRA